MWAEVLLLCLTGSLYPIALIAVVGLLAGERRLQHGFAYWLGGVVISLATGAAIIVAVRLLNLTPNHRPTPSAWVDIGFGVALLAFVTVLIIRGRRRSVQADEHLLVEHDRQPETPRDPPLWRAFVTGIAVYSVMLSYFAAVKIVASQSHSTWEAVVALVPLTIVSLTITEVPLVAVAVAGSRADPFLNTMSRLVVRYTRPILLLCGGGAAVYLIIKGIARL